MKIRNCGVLLLLNGHTLCDSEISNHCYTTVHSAFGISNGSKLFTVRYELNLCTRIWHGLVIVSEAFSVGREGLADGAAAAMDRPRTVPFTANASVDLCTEYSPKVAPLYFLNIRYSSKYGTFENRIFCGAKSFLRAGFEPANWLLRYTYRANVYCWYLRNSWTQTEGSYWKWISIFVTALSTNQEHRDGTAIHFKAAAQGTCMCT